VEFWETKIARNKHRDEVTSAHLEALGWTVIIVWECELRGKEKAEARIQALADEIRSAGELKRQKEARRRLSRAAAKREREQMLERQDALEKEIKSIYKLSRKISAISKED
jgi:DNA mismatch endonuclease (patch repair protein)